MAYVFIFKFFNSKENGDFEGFGRRKWAKDSKLGESTENPEQLDP